MKRNRLAFLLSEVSRQRRSIEKCEAGVSYNDPEWGWRIRNADNNELKRLETELQTEQSKRRGISLT